MKRILPLIAVFLLSYQLKAQKDSIFFVNGDTLVGTVLKADDDQAMAKSLAIATEPGKLNGYPLYNRSAYPTIPKTNI